MIKAASIQEIQPEDPAIVGKIDFPVEDDRYLFAS